MTFPLRKADGSYAPFLTRVNPSRDLAGNVTGWFGVNTEISEQMKAEQALSVLSSELSHRIKNIFSVVTGLVRVSAKDHPAAKAFASDLIQRIGALATAHDYIRPHNISEPSTNPTNLLDLVNQLLVPYQSDGRIVVTGTNLQVANKAMMSIALLIHELATNATKYGALSVPEGRVEVVSIVSDRSLRIDWIEKDGPPIQAPLAMGFGSSLTRISVEAQLGGRISYDWQPAGLVVCATIPRDSLSG
jgi:two-component sensor histidine kinase